MVGDDTFIFNRGDGQDVVFEHQGIDTLYFGSDITWDDLIFEEVENDMVIKIKDTDDQITVKDWFVADKDGVYRYDNHKIEIFEFADGSKHYKDEITVGDNIESITYNMNEMDNDYVELASNYKTTVNLKQGNNHLFAGQNSDDTYVLNTEQTNILIQDYDGNNTIKFGDGIQLAQTFFAYNEDGLEVWFEYFDAYMQIQGDIDSFNFEFTDGTILTNVSNYLLRDISYIDYIMNENQEELRLLGNDSLTVIDNDRDSNIITNSGDTTIDFGQSHTHVESTNGGNDVYIYNLGDCDKYVNDLGGVDTIRFGEGITTENIHKIREHKIELKTAA
jgi:transcriptional antiterminator Rof (Rho-off)